MTALAKLQMAAVATDEIGATEGTLGLVLGPDGKFDTAGRKVNALTKKALARLIDSEAWEALGTAKAVTLSWPAGLAADRLVVGKLERTSTPVDARKLGAAMARAADKGRLTILPGRSGKADDLALGALLGAYRFDRHRSGEPKPVLDSIAVSADGEAARVQAVAEGVIATRDLVNEPANILTTTEFAARLEGYREAGLTVEVLEEGKLEELGMGALLSVGQGSSSPSKVVVLEWMGGGEAAPVALCGKGVVFDTGGISIKPARGMADMTADMGGAGTVAGTMLTLARRGAKANVVGLVGLVENMPSGTATRPGDVVTSMKGDTIEVTNTDAEGRLVLADVLWYAQERYKPAALIDLATLTGAVVASLGEEMAGLFANDDALAKALTAAGEAEGEPVWRLPMGKAYDEMMKSRVADMTNSVGKPPGAILAAQFLARFVGEGMAWAHLDIAGTAFRSGGTDLAPKGGTGWGVMTLDRYIADTHER